MCMKRMYVNICLGGSLGTMMHMWNEWTDNLGFDPHHHLLRQGLFVICCCLVSTESACITLTAGAQGLQMRYCTQHDVGSRDSNSGLHTCIAGTLFT